MDLEYRLEKLALYGFSARFIDAVSKDNVSTWLQLIAGIYQTMVHLYPQEAQHFFDQDFSRIQPLILPRRKLDRLGAFGSKLEQRGFSANFKQTVERVVYKRIGRNADLITMHFSRDVELRDLVYLEDSIDKYYREVMLSFEGVNRHLRNIAAHNRVIQVREFTHPGSVEIFIAALVAIPAAAAIGGTLLYKAIDRVQSQRWVRVESIAAKLQQSTERATREPVTASEHSEARSLLESEHEERQLLEVVAVEEIFEIDIPVPDDFVEVLANATQEEGAYSVSMNGDYVIGMENRST